MSKHNHPKLLAYLIVVSALIAHWFSSAAAQASKSFARENKSSIKESLILTGDVGNMAPAFADMFLAEALVSPATTKVIFMGDNVYPKGIPLESDSDFRRATHRLERQMSLMRQANVQALFLPGNHDWANAKADGWDAVIREQKAVESYLGVNAFLPKNGCPGPEKLFESGKFTVIGFDSQWWIHSGPKPNSSKSGCSTWDEDGFAKRLEQLLKEVPKGNFTIIAQHHPFVSHGPHGAGPKRCPQHRKCPEYSRMIERVTTVLKNNKALICAGGHDHILEVISGDQACQYYLVSGAGSHSLKVNPSASTLFAGSSIGLMRLDLTLDNRVHLSVLATDPNAQESQAIEVYSQWLK